MKDKKWHQEYYQRNKDKYAEAQRRKRAKNREYIDSLKGTLKCQNCPENHPRCLDFHHEADKVMAISRAARNWGLKRLKEEIAKCVILCANCHRKNHSED